MLLPEKILRFFHGYERNIRLIEAIFHQHWRFSAE